MFKIGDKVRLKRSAEVTRIYKEKGINSYSDDYYKEVFILNEIRESNHIPYKLFATDQTAILLYDFEIELVIKPNTKPEWL